MRRRQDGTDSDDAAGDATHGRRGHLRVVPEVAHTDFTPTATDTVRTRRIRRAPGTPGAPKAPRAPGAPKPATTSPAPGTAMLRAERYDEAHPVFTSTPDAGDKPFDHEGLW